MAINKNFVVKNGFEASTNLILADSDTRKVGIGTTTPKYTLHVNGGIGVTDLYTSGIGTIVTFDSSNGTITNLTGTAGTITTLNSTTGTITNLTGTAGTITTFNSSNGTITNLTGTAGTITTFNSTTGTITNLTNTNLNVAGVATIGTLNAVGIGVTNFTVYNNLSVAGIGTLGSLSIDSTQVISSTRQLQNIATLDATTTATIEAAIVNAPNTFTDLSVTGISTLGKVEVSSGIITAISGIVTYFGDGSNLTGIATGLTATIGISSSSLAVGTGITVVNVVGIGFTADASGTTANLYLPAPGISLGLAIALGG